MTETPQDQEGTPVADATGGEENLEQTVFPEDEYPDPPQNTTDLGAGGVA